MINHSYTQANVRVSVCVCVDITDERAHTLIHGRAFVCVCVCVCVYFLYITWLQFLADFQASHSVRTLLLAT